MGGVLVIVPCGKRKIWDHDPTHGPAKALEAYTGTLFRLNRAYAEKYGDRWLVLSAKYGFIPPEFEIPGPYDVSFKRKNTHPIGGSQLHAQIGQLDLHEFSTVIGLGGAAYREAIRLAFAEQPVSLEFPFAGQRLGIMMRSTKRAIESGSSGISNEREVGST